MISSILAVITGLMVFAADRLSKYIVSHTFVLNESKEFINGFMDFVYINNPGAAWGMLSGKTWFLVLLSVVLLIFGIIVFVKYRNRSQLFLWAFTFVVSGGLGNLFDRIFRKGLVIDFLHFEFWPSFPVFNLADCAICLGAGLLILYFVLDIIKESKEKSKTKEIDNNNGDY